MTTMISSSIFDSTTHNGKINKNTVNKLLREGKVFTGYLVASNVNSYHVNNGWHIGYLTTVVCLEQLNDRIADYAMYNCNSELGNQVRLWQVGVSERADYLEYLKSIGTEKLTGSDYDNLTILLYEERKSRLDQIEQFNRLAEERELTDSELSSYYQLVKEEQEDTVKIYPSYHAMKYIGAKEEEIEKYLRVKL